MARSKGKPWPYALHAAMRARFAAAGIPLEREPSEPQFDTVHGLGHKPFARHNYTYLFKEGRTAFAPEDISDLLEFVAPTTARSLRPPRRGGMFAKRYRLAKGRAARINVRVDRRNDEDETETAWFAACHVLDFDSAFEQTIAYVRLWLGPTMEARYRVEAITGLEFSFDAPASYKGDKPHAVHRNPRRRRREKEKRKPAAAKRRATRKNAAPSRKRK